ncbi:PepSY domain-containing protein [Rhodanobacter sp. BL-MT-08]
MSTNHRFLKLSRTVHLYLGVFMAPALLFFAITGGLQTFSLHETTRGSSYTPPAWLATLALLHKKQTIVAPIRKARPPEGVVPAAAPGVGIAGATSASSIDVPARARPAGPSAGPSDRDAARPKKNLLPMKIFFALVSISLCLSTLTGLYMAYRFSRRPVLVTGILVAGVVVPMLLLVF